MEDRTVLIDTSVIIDYFRKKDKLNSLFHKLSLDYDICISSVTEFELLIGNSINKSEVMKKILDNIQIVPFDSKTANIASQIYIDLRKNNMIIDFRDIFIASAAMVCAIPLVTFNTKHFERIKNLELLDFSLP